MASYICSDCIEDTFLRAIVDKEGESADCDVCMGHKPKAITVSRLGEILQPILRDIIAQGEYVRRFSSDEDDSGYLEQEGDDLDYFVEEVLGQYFDFNDEIIDAVIDAEGCWPPDGDEPFFSNDNSYVRLYASDQNHMATWSNLEKQLRHTRRYFSSDAQQLFNELFADIETLLAHTERTKGDGELVHVLPQGSHLYRSRICDSASLKREMMKQPYKHIGPCPSGRARAGRMNADGISLFYGALEWQTCIAELRPALSTEVGTITVETTQPLRVVDFTQFRSVKKYLSYFQPDYKQQAARFAFLRQLGELISRPVVPGNEQEYLITQVMTEYLAYEYPAPFDGLLYESAQRADGTNIVLFPKSTLKGIKYPVKYCDSSVAFHKITKISYEQEEQSDHINKKDADPDYE